MTTPEKKEEEKKKRMPKTVRPKFVVIDGKGYDKCPYRGRGHVVEVIGYNPKAMARPIKLASPDDIYGHIRSVHGFVWLRKGKTAGWWPLSSTQSWSNKRNDNNTNNN